MNHRFCSPRSGPEKRRGDRRKGKGGGRVRMMVRKREGEGKAESQQGGG